MYQNSVDIMGYLGSDAETKIIRDGVLFTVLSLATKRSGKTPRASGSPTPTGIA